MFKLYAKVELLFIRVFFEKIAARNQFKDFYHLLFGPIYFQTLSSAVRLDLFTLISQHNRPTQHLIQDQLKLEYKPARILLTTLTALGLIKKKNLRGGDKSYYKNTLFTQKFLIKDKPQSVIPIVEWYHYIVYKPMFYFYDSIVENKNVGLLEFKGEESTLYQRLTHYPELEDVFQVAMQQISAQANELLARYVDFTKVKKMVDIGGGNAANLIRIIESNPGAQGIVMDLSSVCAIARKNIEDHQMNTKIGVLEGDCFTDDFPGDCDCILFSHFLDIWSEEQNRLLLKKSCEAICKGGMTIVFDIMEHDYKCGPLTAAAGSPYFLTLATGNGLIYSAKEYELWMREAGFSKVKRKYLPRDHIAVIGIK